MVRRSKMPVCGNGIVDVGEDCDCGLNKVIIDCIVKLSHINKTKKFNYVSI
jgi:hypothetical protein